MGNETENQDKEKQPSSGQQEQNNNEEIAKQIPTVIPDAENPELSPDEEDDK